MWGFRRSISPILLQHCCRQQAQGSGWEALSIYYPGSAKESKKSKMRTLAALQFSSYQQFKYYVIGFFLPDVQSLFYWGARRVFELGEEYLFVISLSSIFQIFGTDCGAVDPEIWAALYIQRNCMGLQEISWIISLCGCSVGIKGAAAATGNRTGSDSGMLYFVWKRCPFLLPGCKQEKAVYP